MIVFVGSGSTLFHMTLRRYAQAADELPMLWCALIFLYNVLDYHPHTHQHIYKKTRPFGTIITRKFLTKFIFFITAFISTSIYFYFPQYFFIFFLAYGGTLFSFVAITFYHFWIKTPSKVKKGTKLVGNDQLSLEEGSLSQLPKFFFKLSFCLYFGGFAVWVTNILTYNEQTIYTHMYIGKLHKIKIWLHP
jgi:hypothetical protein